MSKDEPSSKRSSNGWSSNSVIRSVVMFSLFRAVYGTGILVVTYLLASGETLPSWAPWAFLVVSMVLSRRLFSWMKRTWPHLFNPTVSD
ncbi:MAG: hypothetical protein DWC07_01870 [Candidatus Poseidoniales archaeon]|nr:MAG: hypothetical protein DWC07_01870 [Candidatus Poseidoniales archaeon]